MEKKSKITKKILGMLWAILYCFPMIFMVITYFNGTWRQEVNTNLTYSPYETYIQDVATNTNIEMFNSLFGNWLPNVEKAVLQINDTNTQPTQGNYTSLQNGISITNIFNTNLVYTITNQQNATRMANYTTTINDNGSIHFDIQQTSYHNSSYTNLTITDIGLKTFGWSMENEDYETNNLNTGNFYARMKILNLNGLGDDMYLNTMRIMFGNGSNSNVGDYAYTYGNATYGDINAYSHVRNYSIVDNDIIYNTDTYIRSSTISFKTTTTADSTLHHITFDLVIELVEQPLLDTKGYYDVNETKTFYSNNELNSVYQQGVQGGITYKTNTLNLITNEMKVLNACINWYIATTLVHILVDFMLFIPNVVLKLLHRIGVSDAE